MKYTKLAFVSLIGFHLYLLLHIEFTAWPELLVWPYLMIKGWLPYRDIAIAHSPLLIYFLKYFYQIFGADIFGQKLASWFLVFVLDIITFSVARKLFGLKKALLVLLFYIPLQIYYDGNGIWFDHALAIFPISIYYFSTLKRHFMMGFLWGVALLVKQTAFWFLPAIFILFLLEKEKRKFILRFLFGLSLILTVFLLVLFSFDLQNDFYAWAIKFGVGTLSRLPGQIRPPQGRDFFALLPFAAIIPLLLQKNKTAYSLLPWLITGSMGTIPRWGLFHFQPALPFLAIIFALALTSKKAIAYLAILLSFVLVTRGLARDFSKPDRFFTSRDQAVIQEVKSLISSDEAIFVTGYWENLYPLTSTLPAMRPFIQELPWYLSQPSVEESVLSDLSEQKPSLIIKTKIEGSNIPTFVQLNYKIIKSIGGVDIMKPKSEI